MCRLPTMSADRPAAWKYVLGRNRESRSRPGNCDFRPGNAISRELTYLVVIFCCRSQDWKCDHCGHIQSLVRPVTEASEALSKEAKELGSQIKLQASISTVLNTDHNFVTHWAYFCTVKGLGIYVASAASIDHLWKLLNFVHLILLLLHAKHVSILIVITGWYTHTHTRLTALFPGLPGSASTRKVKPIWILLMQETVSGSGISWAICKSAPSSRQITMPAPQHSAFLQAGCPSCRPTNSVKALKATRMI